MSYKRRNYTNGNFNITLDDIDNGNVDYRKAMLYDNVQAINVGEYVICPAWEQVEDLLEVYDDNENWEINEIKDKHGNVTFIVLPDNTTAQQRNKVKAILKGEMSDTI